MYSKIKNALNACNITLWRIREIRNESAELFFVRHELDMRRTKDVLKYEITLFRDGDAVKGATRASATLVVNPSIDYIDLEQQIADAYYAAQFAANPMYELPDPVVAAPIYKSGALASAPLMECAWEMADALFEADIHESAFINSAEIFVTRTFIRIYSSYGTDVFYTDAGVNGEFVVQCQSPEDVEMHHTFSYDELQTEALTEKVKEALNFVCDRASATRTLKSGKYDLILSGNSVSTVLSYYTSRSSASMVYAGYSGWKIGDNVAGDNCSGEKLKLTLSANVPYDGEGIALNDLVLFRDGKLAAVHGSNRFCRYLGIEPTGSYSKLICENGSIRFAEMKNEPCLWVVSFSDFQMDDFSGHFGGEIRLAYLIEDGKARPVTGGSVNGSLLEAQNDMLFSADRYVASDYVGPYALKLKDISVAGI